MPLRRGMARARPRLLLPQRHGALEMLGVCVRSDLRVLEVSCGLAPALGVAFVFTKILMPPTP